ncbi:hypothetical protein FRC12_012335 [Ceratobasidium sp. 428]|nr:hypothetical protein FRC12_012335 [Ceratobasidium sp. 428]
MMAGAVQGPLPANTSRLASGSSPSHELNSSHMPQSTRSSPALKPAAEKDSAVTDISLELAVDRISSALGAFVSESYIYFRLWTETQTPGSPPSTLRMMASSGRKGSSQQARLLKSLHALAEDLPSTLETLGPQQTTTLALVFGFGRAKCFVQLAGADFTKLEQQNRSIDFTNQLVDENTLPSYTPEPSDENADLNTPVPKRVLSSRSPLREITPSPPPTASDLDSLVSQLASTSLKPTPFEATIRKAERALAQAIACSDISLGESLNPMGAQIYLRAPRSFRHPKWVVRQDAARILDAPYEAMISGGGHNLAECVRIRANGFVTSSGEEEEMIWWGWEGRLAGYA